MFCPALDAVPDTFEVLEGKDAQGQSYRVVTIPLAASDDGYRHVAVEVALVPFVHQRTLFYEFQFVIVVTDDADGDVFRTCVRDMAKGYIPAEVRPLVMPTVCAAARALVENVQPELIYRATKATQVPPKALVKHQMITDTFVEFGYAVIESGTNDYGQEFWTLQRQKGREEYGEA